MDTPEPDLHEVRVTLPPAHVDERGAIQPLLETHLRSTQLITSRAGVIRANHYHRSDSHYMYVVEGEFDYYYRPALSTEEPTCLRVRAGELIFTPARVEHALRFLAPTTFVNFSDSARDQAAYEEDIVRVELLAPLDAP